MVATPAGVAVSTGSAGVTSAGVKSLTVKIASARTAPILERRGHGPPARSGDRWMSLCLSGRRPGRGPTVLVTARVPVVSAPARRSPHVPRSRRAGGRAAVAVLPGAPPPAPAATPAAAASAYLTGTDYCLGQCNDILPPGENGNAT